jgi:hypothetical protein
MWWSKSPALLAFAEDSDDGLEPIALDVDRRDREQSPHWHENAALIADGALLNRTFLRPIPVTLPAESPSELFQNAFMSSSLPFFCMAWAFKNFSAMS